MITKRLITFLAILLVTTLAVAPARADEDARAHYRAGQQAYRDGDYPVAVRELKRAYDLQPLPLLLMNIGTTYRKMGERAQAAQYFQRYLEEAPADARDRDEATRLLAEVSDHVLKEDNAPKLIHDIVESAPPDEPVDIHAKMDAELVLFYRPSGNSDFTRVPMRAHGAEKVARVPAASLTGVAMEYYIEARDAGQVIETSGSAQKPNVVLVDPSAPSQQLVAMASSRPQKDEAPTNDVTKEDDDEPAPVLKQQKPDRFRAMDDEVAPLPQKQSEKSHRRVGAVFWSGLVIAAVGAGGLALGITGNLIARQQATALGNDSNHSPSFQFSDPTAPGGIDDASIEAKGRMWNTIGIAGTAGGSALLGVGLIMMIVDGARHHGSSGPERAPKHHHEEDASWYLAPSAGTRTAGIGGGFTF